MGTKRFLYWHKAEICWNEMDCLGISKGKNQKMSHSQTKDKHLIKCMILKIFFNKTKTTAASDPDLQQPL